LHFAASLPDIRTNAAALSSAYGFLQAIFILWFLAPLTFLAQCQIHLVPAMLREKSSSTFVLCALKCAHKRQIPRAEDRLGQHTRKKRLLRFPRPQPLSAGAGA
jgi:hypothetical protein